MQNKYLERPGVLSEEEARPIFEPYLPGMIGDFQDSFGWVQDILNQDAERRATFDTSTVAGMVFNRFVILFGRRHSGSEDVDLRKYGRMMRALLGNGRIAMRFKKLRQGIKGELCSGNVKTNAQGLIYYQLGFEGMKVNPTELTFGYTTDASNTIVSGLYVTCPISWNRNKWVLTLESGEQEGTLPFAAPTDPNASSLDQATVVITSKTRKAKAEQG